MLQERRPLEILDANKQHGLKRVQPSRAAKTSHKWLSTRNEDSANDNVENLTSNFGCDRLLLRGEEKVGGENFGEIILQKSGAVSKSRSEQPNGKDPCRAHRLPLQALSVPSMKPFGANLFGRAHPVSEYQTSFFPPLPKSPDDSDNSTMSTGGDTASDTSLPNCEESNDVKNNDSAFFSCTQSSAPFIDSQESKAEEESDLHGRKSEVVTCRPPIRQAQNLDVVDEYFPDILMYMRDAENRYRPRPNFMRQQPEISSSMRTKLVDWMIEVQDEYKLENETVSLAVAYSDRFLSSVPVARPKLQLLGTTALFVASKYEEVYPPDADEFAYITADTYAKADVITMERLLLKVLGTTMAIPTVHQFLGLLLHNSTVSNQFRLLATYLTELTMLYDRYHYYSYSILAAASVCAAHYLTRCHVSKVEKEEEKENGFSKPAADCFDYLDFECELSPIVQSFMKDLHEEIFACSLELLLTHRNITSAPEQFVREKYLSKRRCSVALIPSPVGNTSSIRAGEGAAAPFGRNDILSVWIEK